MTQLSAAVGERRAARLRSQADDATRAFRRERYDEAARTLRRILREAPGVAPLRELLGLSLYRLGRWRPALRELEHFATQTGSVEQHPVLADCYRAVGRYTKVEELWHELREASPSAPLVAEGRIVAAGALADQGHLDEAIARLGPAVRRVARPKEHHLRQAYALADLYERAGSLARARELFIWISEVDPGFADVTARLDAIG